MSDGPHGVRAEINWNDWGYAKWTNDSITAFSCLDLSCRYLNRKCPPSTARLLVKKPVIGKKMFFWAPALISIVLL